MKKTFIFLLSSVLIAVIGFFSFNNTFSDASSEDVTIRVTEGTPMADFSDKRNLAGVSDYIFTGEVISQIGQVDAHFPTTQYNIKVSKEFKGNFSKNEIAINQYGGYLIEEVEEGKEEKVLHLFENDPLLEVNKEYFFAANKQDDGSILLIPLHGNTLIEDKNKKEVLQKEFVEAVKNQKIPELKKRINENQSNNK